MEFPVADKPIVATMIGDPAGIGPEVVAKALATGEPYQQSRPLLIGSVEVMEQALEMTGVDMTVRKVESAAEAGNDPKVMDVLDSGLISVSDYELGVETASCGAATAAWMGEMKDLAESGQVQGTIMGPINTGSLKLADKLGSLMGDQRPETFLTLFTGPLRIVHLTDHEPLNSVSGLIKKERVHEVLGLMHTSFSEWGVENPRIGVAGFNPHAMGVEDAEEIAPGVELAKADGINVTGPISPDTVFRHCIDGVYDIVLAMYHDQGHIAVKTYGFVGNCAMFLGLPFLQMSVAHGTAFDIVGQNIASHEMILMAMNQTASLAAGDGFAAEETA